MSTVLAEIQNSAGHSPENSITPEYALSEALEEKLPEVLKKSKNCVILRKRFFFLDLKI